MVRTSNARQDAIDTAVRLFRTQGYSATGLTQLLEESGAPKGSFYFHFPGGKEELALEALRVWGDALAVRMKAKVAETRGDAGAFVRALFDGLAKELNATGCTGGCVAASLAAELTTDKDEMAAAVAEVINSWIAIIADGVEPVMATRKQALAYATALMGTLSGLRALARAERSTRMFKSTAEFFVAALPAPKARRSGARTAGA
ncbi:MAG: TetR/AcrR family transcriptional regulator [Nevskia sp.]